MGKALSSINAPKVNYFSDTSLVNNYREMNFLSDAFKYYDKTMPETAKENADESFSKVNTLFLVSNNIAQSAYRRVVDPDFSDANQLLRTEIAENLPGHRMTGMISNMLIREGNIARVAYGNVLNKAGGAPLIQAHDMYEEARAKLPKDGLKIRSGAEKSYEDLMDFEELSLADIENRGFEEMKFGEGENPGLTSAQPPERAVREQMSYKAFQWEVQDVQVKAAEKVPEKIQANPKPPRMGPVTRDLGGRKLH